MRRAHGSQQNEPVTYAIGKYSFDFTNQTLTIGNNKQAINIKEAAILKLLYEHKGRILDRKNTLKNCGAKVIILPAAVWMYLYPTCANI